MVVHPLLIIQMAHPDSSIARPIARPIGRLPCEVLCLLLGCVPMAHNIETLAMSHIRNQEVNRLALVCCEWHKIILSKQAASRLKRMVTVSGASYGQLPAAESKWWTVVRCICTTDAQVTDAKVMQVVEGCPGLTSLNLRHCHKLEALPAGLNPA